MKLFEPGNTGIPKTFLLVIVTTIMSCMSMGFIIFAVTAVTWIPDWLAPEPTSSYENHDNN